MAADPQQPPTSRFVDLPDLAETFADSIHTMVWDGQTLRIEFTVTRFADSADVAKTRRHPACRLVLTSSATVELFNRLQQTMAALKQAGAVSQRESRP